jgi:Ran GTPase-activating protein (RanGAP) involved in mRNA processing and transport
MDGKLRLENYTLNKEVTKSLAEVLKQFPDLLDSIHFNRNGMKDEEMALFISALGELRQLKCLILKHNYFGEESYQALLPILQRGIGDSLSELRLVSCNTNSIVLEKVLDAMGGDNS